MPGDDYGKFLYERTERAARAAQTKIEIKDPPATEDEQTTGAGSRWRRGWKMA
jgi:hypothetical protein